MASVLGQCSGHAPPPLLPASSLLRQVGIRSFKAMMNQYLTIRDLEGLEEDVDRFRIATPGGFKDNMGDDCKVAFPSPRPSIDSFIQILIMTSK
jgi:hypothetical protein